MMHRIGTRFCLVVGVFALAFSAIVMYRAWLSARQCVEDATFAKAEIALAFDLAVRQYVQESVRPEMARRAGADEFVPSVMSTSRAASIVMDKVRAQFPDCKLRFPSENPRNPANEATADERNVLAFFRSNPEETMWKGQLELDGVEYFAHAHAMRLEESCLQCHGLPENAPQALVEHYGTTGGFGYKVGDLVGMDMVAVPTDHAYATLSSHLQGDLLTMGIWLALLFAGIFGTFYWIVGRRLQAITGHIRAAASGESIALEPVPETGSDEITILASCFNSLTGRLHRFQESLTEQVRQRTEELSNANEHFRREQKLLKQSLRMHDRERQVIAYEIHDGLAQQLVGAEMALQLAGEAFSSDAEQTNASYRAGMSMLSRCISETRRLIHGVRPPMLDEEGIVTAIQNLLAEDANGYAEPEFHHPGTIERMEPVVENAVYRVVQEAVTNARHHSGSDKIRVTLALREERLHVEVQDWGCGFDPKQKKGKAMGLRGIKKRAKLLGGQATVESKPGQGTRIIVNLPLTLPEDDSDDSDF